jgi:hypothetical protein
MASEGVPATGATEAAAAKSWYCFFNCFSQSHGEFLLTSKPVVQCSIVKKHECFLLAC